MLSSTNTIGAKLASRVNNFDFLRLAAAFAVIFSHAYPIRDGNSDAEPYRRLSGYCSLGEVAVAVFFVISGMLVARSFIADPSPGAFLKKRSLRIFPGLIMCIAFCIFVIGAWLTDLKFREYLSDHDTLLFARNAVLWPGHYDLPGVFEQYQLGDPRCIVNGSLWTLPFEFILYLGILVLGVTRLLGRKWWVIALAAALLLEWVIAERLPLGVPGSLRFRYRSWYTTLPHLGFLFFSGTLLLLFKDKIVLDWRIFAACVLIIALSRRTPPGYFLQTVCLPYIVMYLAFAPIPFVQSTAKWGDFSYGVYLYGYPVEQVLMRNWGEKLPFPAFILLSCAGALTLGVLSWHLVEKQAMKWKKGSSRDGNIRGANASSDGDAATGVPAHSSAERSEGAACRAI